MRGRLRGNRHVQHARHHFHCCRGLKDRLQERAPFVLRSGILPLQQAQQFRLYLKGHHLQRIDYQLLLLRQLLQSAGRNALRFLPPAPAQSLDPLLCRLQLTPQFRMGNLEAPHGRTPLLRVGLDLLPQLRLQPRHFRPCLTQLLAQSGTPRIRPIRLSREFFRSVLDQGVQGILHHHVLEVILLPPALEQMIRHLGGGQIRPVRQDHRLPTVVTQHRDLPHPQILRSSVRPRVLPRRTQPADPDTRLLIDPVGPALPVHVHVLFLKTVPGHLPPLAATVGDDINAHRQQAPKEFGTEAAPVKQHRETPLGTHQGLDLRHDRLEHQGQVLIHRQRHHQQGHTLAVVDPDIGGCGRGHLPLGFLGLGQRFLAVVLPNMPIHVQEGDHRALLGQALCRQRLHQGNPLAVRRQLGQLAAQRFDLGQPIQADEWSQFAGGILLEVLWPLDPQQGAEKQGHHHGAQTIKSRGQGTVNLLEDGQGVVADQQRQRQPDTGTREGLRIGK